jgi:hypothetical protein
MGVICGLSTSDFSGDGTRLQSSKHGEAPEEEREFRTLALAAHKVELIRKPETVDLLNMSGPLQPDTIKKAVQRLTVLEPSP